MKKLQLLLILFQVITAHVKAQTQPYGTIDIEDLKLTTCPFEKDANAMLLFDKAEVNTGFTSTTIIRHKRIKIFNEKGMDAANVTLEYYTGQSLESLKDVEAETINLNKNVIEFTPVDKKLIYHVKIDKTSKKLTFIFPKVRPGSVIEFSYKLIIGFDGYFPDWIFQSDLPTRYSELKASIRRDFSYKINPRVYQPYAKNQWEPWLNFVKDTIGTKYTWALSDVHSFKDEPFATSREDNIQGIWFMLVGMKFTSSGALKSLEKPWRQIGGELVSNVDFGQQLKVTLKGEDTIISKAKVLLSDKEKIGYIFNYIKKAIKWNGVNNWYTNDGIKKAWDKKLGNSTEINLILCRYLNSAGVKCYPIVISTRDNGKVNNNYPSIHQFNKTIIYCPTVDKQYYILDASDKYNSYSDTPFDALNSYGLMVDPTNEIYILYYLKNELPSRQIILIDAEIKAEGSLEGLTQINSFSYNKHRALKLYAELGEAKYLDQLKNDDNNLKVASFKMENQQIDTLPLTQNIQFKYDLPGSDEKYIYVNPNLFTGIETNPFLSETRNSTIDFGYLNQYSINERFKIPQGYKVDVLPKILSLVMPDKSIIFKRAAAEQDGQIIVHYTIEYKKSLFGKEEYPQIHEFYKKMYEMLNEQIILKKS